MKVKILKDVYDGKRKIFSKDEILNVLHKNEQFICLKAKWGTIYSIDTDEENLYYTILEKKNEN